jgi:hypothetical protein
MLLLSNELTRLGVPIFWACSSWQDISVSLLLLPLPYSCPCLLYMLLDLASVFFLGSESLGARDHISLSQIGDFPFRHLLQLAGSRWRYSTPPPHRFLSGARGRVLYSRGTDNAENISTADHTENTSHAIAKHCWCHCACVSCTDTNKTVLLYFCVMSPSM